MSPNSSNIYALDIAKEKLLKARDRIESATDKRTLPFKREIVWKNVMIYVIGHLMGIYGFYVSLFYVPWSQFFLGKSEFAV